MTDSSLSPQPPSATRRPSAAQAQPTQPLQSQSQDQSRFRPQPLADPLQSQPPVSSLSFTAQTAPVQSATPAQPGVPEPEVLDAIAADPLSNRPRISSIVLCAVLGLALLALGALTWWLAVRTEIGQQFDDLALSSFASVMPGWMSAPTVLGLPLGSSWMMIAVAAVLAVAGLVVALVRRRWWLAGQVAVFALVAYAAAKVLKEVLPREALVRTAVTESGVPLGNTSPSGHAALTVVAALALTCAVPRCARAVTALLTGAWTVLVSALLIAWGWHRPSDVVVAYLLAGGLALIALAFTRASGMDRPGSRAASPGVQVTCSVLVTAAVMGLLYGAYVIWQLVPGLEVGAEWAQTSVCAASMVMIASTAALVFGTTLALRQLTASPLSRVGLLGAPPAPPKASGRART